MLRSGEIQVCLCHVPWGNWLKSNRTADCYVVGEIEVNFSNADLNEFPSKYIDGWRVYLLKYTLKVIFGAQDGVLKFEAASQGKTIGRTSINFNTIKYY